MDQSNLNIPPPVARNPPMQLRAMLLEALPAIHCEVDLPSDREKGVFWIDCVLGDHVVEACWQKEGGWQGWSVSCSKTTVYGEGPDETGFATIEAVRDRIVELLTTKSYTTYGRKGV